MSFLDNLLALENPLEEGQEILRFPRTWRNYLPWSMEPFCYKTHKTKGGLYLALPHDDGGSLFLSYPHKDFVEEKSFKKPYSSIASFDLRHALVLAKKDVGLMFGSLLCKTVFHEETNIEVIMSVYYGTTPQEPDYLKIDYAMILHQEDYKKVSFEITREDTVSASGPDIETNMSKERFWSINYDATLNNLVSLFTKKELGPEQFSSLLSLNYVKFR